MRKFNLYLGLAIFFSLAIGVLLLESAPVHAQGTFSCIWHYPTLEDPQPMCIPDLANHKCASGYIPDAAYCLKIVTVDECNRQQSVACVRAQEPSDSKLPTYSQVEKWLGTEFGTFTFRETSTIGDIINLLLKYVFVFAGLILFVYLIIGGFGLLTSGGDPKAVESAKGKITNAIIGFVIIFISYWLVQILEIIFGIEILGI